MKLADAPHFLSHDELVTELRRYTYRAGWEMSLYRHPWEGTFLRVVCTVPDGYHPGDQVQLRINSPLPPMPSVEYFGHWLLWRVLLIENHEAREFLRRDGDLVANPHDVLEP